MYLIIAQNYKIYQIFLIELFIIQLEINLNLKKLILINFILRLLLWVKIILFKIPKLINRLL